jgi:uncharacterized protein involved in type VI secretion and phage assembly
MSDQLTNRIRREIARYLSGRAQPRNAVISSYDPNRYAVKVRLMPEAGDPAAGETPESGWLPLHSQFVGNGWGLQFGPAIGDQVSLRFQEDDQDSASVEGRFFDSNNVAPKPGPPSGEAWLSHKSGSYFKLTNDGKVSVNSKGVEIDVGDLTQALQTLCTQALRDWAANHVHPNTGPPTTPPPANALTTILKAN